MKGLQLAALGFILWKLLGQKALTDFEKKRAFMAIVLPVAAEEVALRGWDPKIAWAVATQAALESGAVNLEKGGVYAMTSLAEKYNNLFGIKVGSRWRREGKPSVNLWTKEHVPDPDRPGKFKIIDIKDDFRVYPDWGTSIRDNIELLSSLSRYRPVVEAAKAGDVLGYFDALKESGYSTHRRYPGLLADVRGRLEEAVV